MRVVSPEMATGRVARVMPQPIRRRNAGRSLRQALNLAAATVRQWARRRRERAELARLDDRMLRDIGVTPGDAWREINKPFWRP
jgi:uncharacterized protein YjiS (DUF1127 family)